MIQLNEAAKRFGPKTLFENLDWLVTPGTIVTMKGASIGYLPQEGLSLSGRTVNSARATAHTSSPCGTSPNN
jgi:ATP-binding cassette subfamily F protein 3